MLKRILTALCLAIGAAAAAQAQTPNAQIIIVDFDRVSREALVGQDISAQMESNRVDLESYARQIQQQLGAEQQELQQQRSIVSQEAFQQRLQQFQQKAQQQQGQLQTLTQQARQAMQQANLEVQRALRPIVRQVMEEKGANVVLDKALVAQHAAGLDVTTEVIERLNQTLSEYDVNLPEIPSAGSASAGNDGDD